MASSIEEGLSSFTQAVKADAIYESIYSIVLYGSYIRGDFLPGVSDLDLYVVFRDDPHAIERIKGLGEECLRGVRVRHLDWSWSLLGDVEDPLRRGFPFKFLTVYQRDFLAYHRILLGEPIAGLLPRYGEGSLIDWRLDRILRNVEETARNPYMLCLAAGEVIRLMALRDGAPSISKSDVASYLARVGDEDASEVFSAYLEGRPLERPSKWWVGFISRRVEVSLMKPRSRGAPGSSPTR